MRQLLTEEWIEIPAGIECHIKSRVVTIKGPKGEIKKDFSHIACELQTMKQNTKARKGTYIRIRMWFGTYKNSTSVNTLASLIKNMMTGCSEVFVYKMKLVYAHFPINAKVDKDGKGIEINNFLGGAHARKIKMQPGVTVTLSEDVKDELVFNGVDNAAISLSCAQISQVCKIGKKDERKFLDGIYVTDKSVKFPAE